MTNTISDKPKMEERQIHNIEGVHKMNIDTFGVHCKDCVEAGHKSGMKEIQTIAEQEIRADERQKTLDAVEKIILSDCPEMLCGHIWTTETGMTRVSCQACSRELIKEISALRGDKNAKKS